MTKRIHSSSSPSGLTALAQDRAVFRATKAWPTPLGLLGIATVFGAVFTTLATIRRIHLPTRRHALMASLPALLGRTQGDAR